MRGDRPVPYLEDYAEVVFTPHARGSTLFFRHKPPARRVYPACAGIDPWYIRSKPTIERLPRMRGDRPCNTIGVLVMSMFTPHARGSTSSGSTTKRACSVYPACAGIDRGSISLTSGSGSLPRMRGDRPFSLSGILSQLSFTPHARGSTQNNTLNNTSPLVYPACAGIDPPRFFPGGFQDSLPRMRGDRPSHPGA